MTVESYYGNVVCFIDYDAFVVRYFCDVLDVVVASFVAFVVLLVFLGVFLLGVTRGRW